MKRCYIYARVSTSEQNKGEVTSIDNQIDTCKHFIALRQDQGWQHIKTITDPGYSGKDLDRPGMKELMAAIEAGQIDVIVTYKVDRVSRSLIRFYDFNKLLESKKIEFASATQNFDTSSSSGRLMLNILLSFAEYERELISERTADKMLANFERGKWNGGFVPYGYEYDAKAKDLKAHKQESKAVKMMFESIASGFTLSRTAKLLQEHGFTTKSRLVKRKNGKEVNVGGKRFREDVVHRMIKNPFYCGYMKHNGQLGKHRYEKLIPKTLYDKANSAMKKTPPSQKTKINRDADRHVHLLKGLLKCDNCGCTMTPLPSGKKDKSGNPYLYYVCTEVSHYKKESNCKVRSLSARLIEETVVHYLKDLSAKPELIRRAMKSSNQGCSAELKRLTKQEASIQAELDKVTRAIRNVIELAKKSPKVSKDMQDDIANLSDKRDRLMGELERLRVEINLQNSHKVELDVVQKNLIRFKAVVNNLSLHDKKELMAGIIKEVRVQSVNHKKGKAPTEVGAFDTQTRTSWLRIVITIYAMPALPVTYDEEKKTFVFSSKWLPLLDAFKNPTPEFKILISSVGEQFKSTLALAA